MLDFIKNMLADERGSISHKRIIATIGAICLFCALMLKIPINEHLADLVFYLVAFCMGFSSIDKFSQK